MTTLLDDAFAHHIWATERIIDTCAELTEEQLTAPAPGTYGPISDTLRHLVSTDAWYLTFFRDEPQRIGEDTHPDLAQLRTVIGENGRDWAEILARDLDGETAMVEQGDGWNFHAPTGLRLAQVVQHGTDHRSQVCTALSSFNVEPPQIDLWAFGEATGRTRPEYL
ncbi:MAG: DinB family protein [Candidatus Limnocylindria bacterium]